MRRSSLLLALLVLPLLEAGCRPRPLPRTVDAATPTQTGRPDDPGAALDELIRHHLDATVAGQATVATWLGLPGAEDRLDDLSVEGQGRETLRLRLLLDQLTAIPEARLDAARRLDRLLLEREARLALFDLGELRPLERNPIRSLALAQAALDDLLTNDGSPLGERMRALTGRLGRFRPFLEDARRQLRAPPELSVRKAVELAQGLRAFVAETLPKAVQAVGEERLSTDFRAAQAEALRALDDHLAWMQRDLLPRAKGELALGRDRLVERLRLAEGFDGSIDGLLATAERELKAQRSRYEDVARLVAPGRGPVEAPRLLEEDHPSAEELLPATGATLEQLAGFIRDHRLLTLPEARPRVAEMPPYLWGYALLSRRGPFETRARDVHYYVEPVDRDWNKRRREEHLRALNRAQIVATAVHEVYPGHFVQSEALRRATTMARLSSSDGFVEGWAAYGEGLLLEKGFGAGDPKIRLALQRGALLRLCRLVAALRLHAFAAKVDEATALFTESCYLEEYAARREAERAAIDPMVLAPALGKLQLMEVREAWRQVHGDEAPLAELHDRLLAHGAPPVPMLRRLLFTPAAAPTP